MLCYVDHHDDAYAWASKRKIERHPKTGAAQLVEVRERIEEITIQTPVIQPPQQKPLLYGEVPDDDLLAYGVPTDWLDDVRLATEDTLFDIAERLPQEAAEALLELATGSKPTQPTTISVDSDPFTHPDAQRRFRVMSNQEELQRALEFQWAYSRNRNLR
ncbi:hypothetical protein SPB21_11580 [Leptothoe sp. ISB3NOV94-8A]